MFLFHFCAIFQYFLISMENYNLVIGNVLKSLFFLFLSAHLQQIIIHLYRHKRKEFEML